MVMVSRAEQIQKAFGTKAPAAESPIAAKPPCVKCTLVLAAGVLLLVWWMGRGRR